jgi:hypothetical protein
VAMFQECFTSPLSAGEGATSSPVSSRPRGLAREAGEKPTTTSGGERKEWERSRMRIRGCIELGFSFERGSDFSRNLGSNEEMHRIFAVPPLSVESRRLVGAKAALGARTISSVPLLARGS